MKANFTFRKTVVLNLLTILCVFFSGILCLNAQDKVFISNNGGSGISDAQLNVILQDGSTNTPLDILSLQRSTTGTAANGLGGSILFRNQASNNGFALSSRITSILENATVGSYKAALKFDVYKAGVSANQLYLNDIGLGIGTTSPGAKLDVISQSQNTAYFRGPNGMYLSFYEDNAYRGYIGSFSGAVSDMDFGTGVSNSTGSVHITTLASPKLTVEADGDVGVGTITPTGKLDVQGATNSTSAVIKSRVNYTSTSDVRAMEGISTPAPGYGIGGYFQGGYRGVQGLGVGGIDYIGTVYGVYGSASGGGSNWAGFFASGNVYVQNDLRIGSSGGATGYKLAVDGKIIAEEVRVQTSGSWPDYVFANDYELLDLELLEKQINTHKHLPGIPSASEVESEGIQLGEMQRMMMEKIEELTLHMIQINKEVKALKAENEQLKTHLIK